MEEGKGKELEYADSIDASPSIERGNLKPMLEEVGSRDRVNSQIASTL